MDSRALPGGLRRPRCQGLGGHDLEQVTVDVLEVEGAAAAACAVDLHVLVVEGAAAVGDARRLHPFVDAVELRIADVEGVVNALHDGPQLVEVHGQGVVDLDLGEATLTLLDLEAEDVGEELRRSLLVLGRDDGVVERDGHDALLHTQCCWRTIINALHATCRVVLRQQFSLNLSEFVVIDRWESAQFYIPV